MNQLKYNITREMATRFVTFYHISMKSQTKDFEIHYNDAIPSLYRDHEFYYDFYHTFNHFYNRVNEDKNLSQMMKENNMRQVIPINESTYLLLQSIYQALHIQENDKRTLNENFKLCSDKTSLSEQAINYLHYANKNYHLLNNMLHNNYISFLDNIDIEDYSLDLNICEECSFENLTTGTDNTFYYSTVFGLNRAICNDCLINYEPPSNDDIESGVGELNDEDICICDNDYTNGFDDGWKAAMKYIKKQLTTLPPVLQKCDNCGIERKLKKCSGSCNGTVKYCSTECQLEHWKTTHRYGCLKI